MFYPPGEFNLARLVIKQIDSVERFSEAMTWHEMGRLFVYMYTIALLRCNHDTRKLHLASGSLTHRN